MEIYYNGRLNPSDMLTFTDVHNILTLEEPINGTNANMTLQFNGSWQGAVSGDGQYFLTILDETISNATNPQKANNKRFFIASDNNSTAFSVAQALRNCASLSADFNIIHSNNTVQLVAKTVGRKFNVQNYLNRTSIPSSYLTVTITDGSSYSTLFGGKIMVDVYNDSEYITTLEKNVYGWQTSFEMSPILTTFSKYGDTVPYTFKISSVDTNGSYSSIGEMSAYSTYGYLANQSDKYLYLNGVRLLANTNRGDNGSILYAYGNKIDYSVLVGTDSGGYSVVYSVKNSLYEEIYTYTDMVTYGGGSRIVDRVFTIPTQYVNNAFYVDITVGGIMTRYNVIKPLKATEYHQRIYWRNEYGGISFFDFTGSHSETDSINVETYEKNYYDFYDTNEFDRKRIYTNEIGKSVKLKSHLIEKDGKWIFNSLIRSRRLWTVVNGKTHYIIPKSLEVVEDATYNDIYTATLTYEYSDLS